MDIQSRIELYRSLSTELHLLESKLDLVLQCYESAMCDYAETVYKLGIQKADGPDGMIGELQQRTKTLYGLLREKKERIAAVKGGYGLCLSLLEIQRGAN